MTAPTKGQPRGMMTMGMEMLENFRPNNIDISAIRKELEGPMPLRIICGLAGAVLSVCAGLGMLNIAALLTHPPQFVLQIYECIFGLIIFGTEIKDAPNNCKLKNFIYKWFPFLTVVGGKGVFYIFVGSLGSAFGTMNLLIFVPAMFIAACGVVLILIHFGKCQQLSEKYNMTLGPQAFAAQYDPQESFIRN